MEWNSEWNAARPPCVDWQPQLYHFWSRLAFTLVLPFLSVACMVVLIAPAFAAAFGSLSSVFAFSAKLSAGIPCSLVYLRLSQVDSSLHIITSELNVDHFNTEYLVHLGIFQQTVKNECESKTFKHGSRGSRQPHRTSLVAYSFPAWCCEALALLPSSAAPSSCGADTCKIQSKT